MTAINAKNFRSTLTNWTKGQEKQRDVLQALIVFGLLQYKEHGNTGFLSEAINGVMKVRAIPTNNVKEYIKAHANVVLHENKKATDKELRFVFKKQGKDVKVTEPTVVWYEHKTNKNTKPVADIDGLQLVRNALVKAATALENGKLKAGQADDLRALIAATRELLAPKGLKA